MKIQVSLTSAVSAAALASSGCMDGPACDIRMGR